MVDEKCPNIYPMGINQFPLIRDVVGKPREFLDDLILNINGEVIFTCMGTKPDKNFLLYGPPGCGKTYSIHAINNDLNQNFIKALYEIHKRKEIINLPKEKRNVTALSLMNPNDFKLKTFEYSIGKMGTAYINVGSRRVQGFFDLMFNYAQKGNKTLVILDEVDALLIDRSGGLHAHSEDHKVLETIMTNLQTANDTPNLYVVMMTNLPEICDDASLRAGRIDKKYKFDKPNLEQRKIAFDNFIKQRNEFAMYQVIRRYNLNTLATMTNDFTYADISGCIEGAIKKRAKEILRTRRNKTIPAAYVMQNRLEKAIIDHKIDFKKIGKEFGFKIKW